MYIYHSMCCYLSCVANKDHLIIIISTLIWVMSLYESFHVSVVHNNNSSFLYEIIKLLKCTNTLTLVLSCSLKNVWCYHFKLRKTNLCGWHIVLVDSVCVSVLLYSFCLQSTNNRIHPEVHKLYLMLLCMMSLSSSQNLWTHQGYTWSN